MVKLADAPDLGSGAERHSGSSPLGGTTSGHGARCKGMSKAHPFRFYAGPLAQSILRSVTELPAQWAIPKFGRMPTTPPGLSAEHTPSPFFPKNLRCANLFWEPYSFTYKANLVSPWAFAQGLYSIGRMIPLRAYKEKLTLSQSLQFPRQKK